MTDSQQLQDIFYQACELELLAFKPGNVSIYSPAHDMTAADFITSAKVSAPHLCNESFSLGEKIYHAIKATRNAVSCNTNLGIVLLCAPLFQAFHLKKSQQSLREALHTVLSTTTQDDCRFVYQAIAIAAPGGLGSADEQDVRSVPDVTLKEAMALASEKDLIAKQYITDFREIFDFAILEYNELSVLNTDLAHMAVLLYARFLENFPDSHIQRKFGDIYNSIVTEKLSAIFKLLKYSHFSNHMQELTELDAWFKTNKINPGTTADMVVATFVAVFLEQLISNS